MDVPVDAAAALLVAATERLHMSQSPLSRAGRASDPTARFPREQVRPDGRFPLGGAAQERYLAASTEGGFLLTQHPMTHLVDVVCATCGTSFSVRSTVTAMSVEVCSNCHPAYTGVDRSAVDGSRIERFNRRRAFAAA